jgi:hypothetical protein
MYDKGERDCRPKTRKNNNSMTEYVHGVIDMERFLWVETELCFGALQGVLSQGCSMSRRASLLAGAVSDQCTDFDHRGMSVVCLGHVDL